MFATNRITQGKNGVPVRRITQTWQGYTAEMLSVPGL